jgi:CRP-like cAMP-binding protein
MMLQVDYPLLATNPLFARISTDEIQSMLGCLGARILSYGRDEFIVLEGTPIHEIGILLKGKAVILKENEEGLRSIVAPLLPGECFGETFACGGGGEAMVSVQTLEDSEVLFIDCKRIITTCSSACVFHTLLIENMLTVLTSKIRLLNMKLDIASRKKIRDKLMVFFAEQKKNAKSNGFRIPLNREQLADYLMVDRSALSAELGRMREEGLIDFHKNEFRILR